MGGMRITRDELIEELKRLPTNCEIEFFTQYSTECSDCCSSFHDYFNMKFDRIRHGNPAIIELVDAK